MAILNAMRRLLAAAATTLLAAPLVACTATPAGPSEECVRASAIAEDLSMNVPQTRMLEDPEGSRAELMSAAEQLQADFPKLADRIDVLAERLPANPNAATEAEAQSYAAAANDFQAAAQEFDEECGIS